MDDNGKVAAQKEHHDGRVRVLVADDDSEFRYFIADCLEAAGYQTVLTSDGLEALNAFDVQHPNLAVIDLNMPVMSGYRLLRLLRGRRGIVRNEVPVIAISGDDLQEAMDLVVGARPNAYLQKPFVVDRFIERVDALVAMSA